MCEVLRRPSSGRLRMTSWRGGCSRKSGGKPQQSKRRQTQENPRAQPGMAVPQEVSKPHEPTCKTGPWGIQEKEQTRKPSAFFDPLLQCC
jgi:hypothetical protein